LTRLDDDPRPSWAFVLAGTAAIAMVSAATLPWSLTIASMALGALTLAGADVDARFHLLPDTITFATLVCGIGAAIVLEPLAPWHAVAAALARAAGTAAALAAIRFGVCEAQGRRGHRARRRQARGGNRRLAAARAHSDLLCARDRSGAPLRAPGPPARTGGGTNHPIALRRVPLPRAVACVLCGGCAGLTLERGTRAGQPPITIPTHEKTTRQSVGKEFAILIAVHLSAAELHCPYRIEDGRLTRLLRHYELTIRDVFTVRRSRELQGEVDKVNAGFRDDRTRACDTAWKNFGPGAPFEGFLQSR
jgi:hypothetical protein